MDVWTEFVIGGSERQGNRYNKIVEKIDMNVNGIGATEYPVTGYETRKTERNVERRNHAGSLVPYQCGEAFIGRYR